MLAGCGGASSDVEPDAPIAGCCAFDSRIEVRVADTEGTPLPGVAVELVMLADSATWREETGADGAAGFETGVLGGYAVAVAPPAGFAAAPGEALRDTVTTSRDSLDATVTFRLQPEAP